MKPKIFRTSSFHWWLTVNGEFRRFFTWRDAVTYLDELYKRGWFKGL